MLELFLLWQRSYALSTQEGYSGYGAEQGEKVYGKFSFLIGNNIVLFTV